MRKTMAGVKEKRWSYLTGGNMSEEYENTVPSKESKEKASSESINELLTDLHIGIAPSSAEQKPPPPPPYSGLIHTIPPPPPPPGHKFFTWAVDNAQKELYVAEQREKARIIKLA